MGGMIRRDFLKACLSGVGAFLVDHYFSIFSYAREIIGGRQVSRYTGKFLKGIPSTCEICRARCGIIGFLEGNQLYKIGGNPRHPNSRGHICARGLAGVNLEYDQERLLFPMIRRGQRGDGEWEKISWVKAFEEMISRLSVLRRGKTTESLLFHSGVEVPLLAKRFLEAFGNPVVVDEEGLHQLNRVVGQRVTWGAEVAVPDMAHTRYILNFGANPYETHESYVGLVGRLADARVDNGAKLVTFDPRLSKTAGNSDEWLPIRPGTDAIVALAMAHVIMESGLYDRDFLETWTNMHPADLAGHLSQYTPETAEKVSGIKASDITRIALEFARAKPATTLSGGGLVKHYNGVHNERSVALLNAVTGNIDVRGGFCLPRFYNLGQREPMPAGNAGGSAGFQTVPAQQAIVRIREGTIRCRLYFCHKSNPAYANPNKNLVNEILKDEGRVPYLVVMDTHMSETAHLADLVLPVATYLESWGLVSPPALDGVPFVALRQPIVKPLGKSRSVDEVFCELASRIGGDMAAWFPFNSIEDYVAQMISGIDGLAEAGGLDYLKEHGVWFDPEATPDYQMYRKGGFDTPSGRFEINSERLRRLNAPSLPVYEAIPGHGISRGEFILTRFDPGILTHRTGNCKWLSEIVHDSPLWINMVTAGELHIKRGDLVKVTSKFGSFVARAHLTQGIHPSVVAIADGLGHWQSGHIARARTFKSRDPDTQLLWWGENWLRVSPNAVIPERSDPVGGGQAWMDTRVSLMKI